MRSCLLLILSSIVCISCSVGEAAPRSAAQKKTGQQLVAEANAMIDSINARLSERELAASVASDQLELLDQRAKKLRGRCEKLDMRTRANLEPHVRWVGEVRATATLAIGVLRDESRDFEGDKTEVLLWTRAFKKEIDALERRIDRVAPTTMYFSQRSRKK